MGVRRDIEQELFPDKIYTSPAEIYFDLGAELVKNIEVTFPNAFDEKEWGDKLDRARSEALQSIAASMATEAAYADFSAGNNKKLLTAAANVRDQRAHKQLEDETQPSNEEHR